VRGDGAEVKHGLIQIAGVIDAAEAELLVDSGVDFIGFPLRLRDGREDLSEAAARSIVRSIDPGVRTICITYSSEAAAIVGLCDALGVSWVQLHGPIPTSELAALRALRPRLSVIKSLIVRDNDVESLAEDVRQLSPLVHAFITDTFDPETGRSGATGKVHDWEVSRRIVEASARPVILAGGLRPENVGRAILEVRPAGVDAHTGVEGADGRKDPALVHEFVAAARTAFRRLGNTATAGDDLDQHPVRGGLQ